MTSQTGCRRTLNCFMLSTAEKRNYDSKNHTVQRELSFHGACFGREGGMIEWIVRSDWNRWVEPRVTAEEESIPILVLRPSDLPHVH